MRLVKVLRWARLYGLLVTISLATGVGGVSGKASAKDLPLLVALSDLGETHDGRRIAVFGWVRSAEVKTGRRGSLHLEIVVGEGEHSITVYSDRPVPNIVDREVIVQGVFHASGRFAGHPAEHYIVAEAIVRNWSDTEKNAD